MIVLLELLTALLEYIDLILQLSFFLQEFTLLYKYLTYYAGIMLNAFRYLLCSKLCQHNRRIPTTYTFRQGGLLNLDLQVDRGSDFAAWELQWDSYCSLSGLADQDAAKQVQALTLCFSCDTLSVVQNLGLTDEERASVTSIISAIKRYIDGHVNEMVE